MTSQPHAPRISVEDFRVRLQALKIENGFAIAVSGGRDSMALACLAADFASETGVSVLALTVDHGLRPEASQEARQVADWCAALGLSHKILCWTGEKPATAIQEAAREARYGLLVRAVIEAGLDAVLTAHSADDQAETVFMRLARGAGPRGLGAMQEKIHIAAGASASIRLMRPLLEFSRARMTSTVKACGQSFVDDPSNDDPAYERIRTRALLAALEQQNLLTQKALLRSAANMQKSEWRANSFERLLWRQLSGCFYAWGGVSLDRRACEGLIATKATGLFRRLIFAVSGQPFTSEDTAIDHAFQRVLTTGAATLGGALIKRHGDAIWFLREPAAVLGRAGVAPLVGLPISAGESLLWDHRFIVKTLNDGKGGEILPLGSFDQEDIRYKPPGFQGPREALLAMPVLCCEGALIGAPAFLSIADDDLVVDSLAVERFDGETIRFS